MTYVILRIGQSSRYRNAGSRGRSSDGEEPGRRQTACPGRADLWTRGGIVRKAAALSAAPGPAAIPILSGRGGRQAAPNAAAHRRPIRHALWTVPDGRFVRNERR